MSHSFGVRVGSPVARSVVDPGLPDLVWYGGEEPPDPLESGSWAMFRAGVSTRIFLIPREALTELPAQVARLDDGNQLLEAIPESDWFSFCAVARVHAI